MLRTNQALAITAGTLLALSLSQEIQQLLLPHDTRTFISFQGSMLHCTVSAVQQCSNASTLLGQQHGCHNADSCPSATAAPVVSAVTLMCLRSLSC